MAAGLVLESPGADLAWRSQVGIPIRNLWLLLVYASDLAAFKDRFSAEITENAEIADILARLLTYIVERRLRRNLSRDYRSQHATLNRLRGRVDWLETISGRHLKRGRLVCNFQELTFDTPRNRLVGAALKLMSTSVTDAKLAADCRKLAEDFIRLGVAEVRPSVQELSREQVASHQSEDGLMISVAKLALAELLPSEIQGGAKGTRLERDEGLLRRIFEKAVAGFYRHELQGVDGWQVRSQSPIAWEAKSHSVRALALLPGMRPDIILERKTERRIVIDTKFTAVLTKGKHGDETFKSDNLYQIYAYLRSQAGRGNPLWDCAEGILLYPSLDEDVDEAVEIQGHRIRFVTVNLAQDSIEILNRLRFVVS